MATAKKERDLRRFAIVDTQTGEVLAVGLEQEGADSYVASYNKACWRAGRECARVPITWELAGEVDSRVNHPTCFN